MLFFLFFLLLLSIVFSFWLFVLVLLEDDQKIGLGVFDCSISTLCVAPFPYPFVYVSRVKPGF